MSSSSDSWDFADAVTVLGYFIISIWLLGALFQIAINLARRCLRCPVRLLFAGGAAASAFLFALTLLYLTYAEGGSANLRDFMVGLVCAEFALFFLMLRGAIRATGRTGTTPQAELEGRSVRLQGRSQEFYPAGTNQV